MNREQTYTEQLAAFASHVTYDRLPTDVAHETRRIILDSVGCALASAETDAGRIGIDYGRVLGAGSEQCTVLGLPERSSLHGAAFANTELIASLDMAPINLPAHVAPYVVSAALGFGEVCGASGAEVVAAVTAGLEITCRFAHAMDANREVREGRAELSRVMGFAASIFAATTAAGMLKKVSTEVLSDALAIAAGTSPVNALRAWQMHVPNSSVKYSLGGGLTLAAYNALFMAELGHRGDRQILDDTEYGYRRFIATNRWAPEHLVDGLGEEWMFPRGTHYKPYPHCRVTHALFDAVIDLVRTHDLKPEEIETLSAYGEAWATGLPTYMNNDIERPYDGQFSFAHGLSMAAHLVPPGRDWQDPTIVYAPSVLDLMERVEWHAHPGWAAAYAQDPAARPSRIEIVARGEKFAAERAYPRGTVSPDPTTALTDQELAQKFRHNAAAVLDDAAIDGAHDALVRLDQFDAVSTVLALLVPTGGSHV